MVIGTGETIATLGSEGRVTSACSARPLDSLGSPPGPGSAGAEKRWPSAPTAPSSWWSTCGARWSLPLAGEAWFEAAWRGGEASSPPRSGAATSATTCPPPDLRAVIGRRPTCAHGRGCPGTADDPPSSVNSSCPPCPCRSPAVEPADAALAHEQERLLVHVAADVARRRRERGLLLNYPESVALAASRCSRRPATAARWPTSCPPVASVLTAPTSWRASPRCSTSCRSRRRSPTAPSS